MKALIKSLAPVSTKRAIRKQTILYYQGEIPRNASIIQDGLIKVYSINSMGEEQIVSFQAKYDIFPLPWVFNESNNTLFYYEAVTDCKIISVAKDTLLGKITQRPDIFEQLFQRLMHTHTGLLLRITALEQSRATEKILFTLYYLMFHYGQEKKPGIFTIDLKLTQPAIASLVGLTRETTAKCLNQLRRKGIVSYRTHTYTVNKAKFEKYLGEDAFANLLS